MPKTSLTRLSGEELLTAGGPVFFMHALETELGWMAMLGNQAGLAQLVFGCGCEAGAIAKLSAVPARPRERCDWFPSLAQRLTAYARGDRVTFDDVRLIGHDLSAFQGRVIEACRRIEFGRTLSYGALAAKAGSPGAARAVGNIMAGNIHPLVVPCHRVVHAGGSLGGFSAPDGARMKARLLAMEGAMPLSAPRPRRTASVV